MHDVVVQKLPVRMILDRAGLVGNDGPTHHGSFDLTYLGTLPHIVIMAPSDEIELMNMIQVRETMSCFRGRALNNGALQTVRGERGLRHAPAGIWKFLSVYFLGVISQYNVKNDPPRALPALAISTLSSRTILRQCFKEGSQPLTAP